MHGKPTPIGIRDPKTFPQHSAPRFQRRGKNAWFGFLIALLGVILSFSAQGGVEEFVFHNLDLQVSDLSGTAVPACSVRAYSEEWPIAYPLSFFASTDENGRCSLHLPRGIWKVIAGGGSPYTAWRSRRGLLLIAEVHLEADAALSMTADKTVDLSFSDRQGGQADLDYILGQASSLVPLLMPHVGNTQGGVCVLETNAREELALFLVRRPTSSHEGYFVFKDHIDVTPTTRIQVAATNEVLRRIHFDGRRPDNTAGNVYWCLGFPYQDIERATGDGIHWFDIQGEGDAFVSPDYVTYSINIPLWDSNRQDNVCYQFYAHGLDLQSTNFALLQAGGPLTRRFRYCPIKQDSGRSQFLLGPSVDFYGNELEYYYPVRTTPFRHSIQVRDQPGGPVAWEFTFALDEPGRNHLCWQVPRSFGTASVFEMDWDLGPYDGRRIWAGPLHHPDTVWAYDTIQTPHFRVYAPHGHHAKSVALGTRLEEAFSVMADLTGSDPGFAPEGLEFYVHPLGLWISSFIEMYYEGFLWWHPRDPVFWEGHCYHEIGHAMQSVFRAEPAGWTEVLFYEATAELFSHYTVGRLHGDKAAWVYLNERCHRFFDQGQGMLFAVEVYVTRRGGWPAHRLFFENWVPACRALMCRGFTEKERYAGLYSLIVGENLAWLFNLCDFKVAPARVDQVMRELVVIQDPPRMATGSIGDPVSFQVGALGTGLRYQWMRNGSALLDRTNASLEIGPIRLADAGDYQATVSNGIMCSTSAPVTLYVAGPPQLVEPLGAQVAYAGSRAVITARVTGTPPLTCQWALNGTVIPGATNTTLVITNVQDSNSGSYQLGVSNEVGSLTNLSTTLAVRARPGSLDSSFQPVTMDGRVHALRIQTDGKVLIGGDFTSINGVTRNRIARLNADGSLDASFDPGDGARNWGNVVRCVVVQPDGKILVGGSFMHFDRKPRQGLARLNPNGSLDEGFTLAPGVEGAGWMSVYAVALQDDGGIVIGGDFTAVNGQPRSRLARLGPDGSLDPEFAATLSLNNTVAALLIPNDGRIVIAGDFTEICGTTCQRIARLNADGSLDPTFPLNAGADAWISALTPSEDGGLFVGGYFAQVAGQRRFGLARLKADGRLDGAFAPDTWRNNAVSALAVQEDGKLVVGACNGQPEEEIVRFNADGSLDGTFHAGQGVTGMGGAGRGVLALEVDLEGNVLIGGWFSRVDGQPRLGIARLARDGTPDGRFGSDGRVEGGSYYAQSVAVQDDGKILVGGYFVSVNGVPNNAIARFNPDGSLDPGFRIGSGPSAEVWGVAVQPDGKILIGGGFGAVDGVPRWRIARLLPDGALDPGFEATADSWVQCLVVEPDGKVLVGGTFDSMNGALRRSIVRLNPDGSLDPTFDPGAGVEGGVGVGWRGVGSIALLPDGKIVIGGDFAGFDGTPRGHIARLHHNGQLDRGFASGSAADGVVTSVKAQGDGKVLISGSFGKVDGIPRGGIARLNSDGSLDASFDPGSGSNAGVAAVAIQPDGKIVLVGAFTSFDGVRMNRVVRLNSDGSLDRSFDPGPGIGDELFVTSLNALALQRDGRVLIVGRFFNIDGSARNGIARLNGDGLPSRLAATQTGTRTRLGFEGEAGMHYLIERSDDLVDWRRWTDLIGTGSFVPVADLVADDATEGFYRAVLVPSAFP